MALVLVVSACAYIPPFWNIGAEIDELDFIEPGVTTKEQVLAELGKPDTLYRKGVESEFFYSGQKSAGGILIGYGAAEIAPEYWSVIIRFDENDLVIGVRTREWSSPPVPCDMENRIASRDREKFRNLDFIEPGVTTKEQVLERFGEPDTSPRFAGGRNYYIYRGEECPTTNIARRFWGVVVEFDKNDLVIAVRTQEW